MYLFARLFALAAAAVPFVVTAAPVPRVSAAQIVPGKWIVQLKPSVDVASIAAHHAKVRAIHAQNIARRDVAEEEIGGVEHEYGFGDFHGYSGAFDKATIEELKGMDEVLLVEPDTIMATMDLRTQSTSPWNLGSISAKSGIASDYIYDSAAGQGQYNYVVDTGIRTTHQEFGGRAIWGYNAVNDNNTDNAGHGTHVSGIIGGSTYGVAKKTSLIAVKIFEGNTGSTSTVIKGFSWAVDDICNNNRQNVSVINMSLGGTASQIWDSAITMAYANGVLAVVAAGNDGADASQTSPARSPEAITVGNIQQDLKRAVSSNWGAAVDIFAPGTGIVSSYRTSDSATQSLTGTSMASPHVAGLVSYLRSVSGGSLSAEDVKQKVYSLADTGKVGDLKGSADRLAYNGNGR